MIIDLVRHASTGRTGHLDGRSDSPLTPLAGDAVVAACSGLEWTKIITSPLKRAHDTALALADVRDMSVIVDDAWSEYDFGDWDGRHARDIEPTALAAFHADPLTSPAPGGELWAAFQTRIGTALAALIENPGSDHSAVTLVVSHAGALRMALALACGFPLPALWALRIDYGTRLRMRLECGREDRPWGELLEVRQP